MIKYRYTIEYKEDFNEVMILCSNLPVMWSHQINCTSEQGEMKMGTSAVILTKKDKYSPDQPLADTIVAAFHSDAALYFYNNKTYTN